MKSGALNQERPSRNRYRRLVPLERQKVEDAYAASSDPQSCSTQHAATPLHVDELQAIRTRSTHLDCVDAAIDRDIDRLGDGVSLEGEASVSAVDDVVHHVLVQSPVRDHEGTLVGA